MQGTFICHRPSKIIEIFNIFKGLTSCLDAMILFGILSMRQEHTRTFSEFIFWDSYKCLQKRRDMNMITKTNSGECPFKSKSVYAWLRETAWNFTVSVTERPETFPLEALCSSAFQLKMRSGMLRLERMLLWQKLKLEHSKIRLKDCRQYTKHHSEIDYRERRLVFHGKNRSKSKD